MYNIRTTAVGKCNSGRGGELSEDVLHNIHTNVPVKV